MEKSSPTRSVTHLLRQPTRDARVRSGEATAPLRRRSLQLPVLVKKLVGTLDDRCCSSPALIRTGMKTSIVDTGSSKNRQRLQQTIHGHGSQQPHEKMDVTIDSAGSSKTQNGCSKSDTNGSSKKNMATKNWLVPAKIKDGGSKLVHWFQQK